MHYWYVALANIHLFIIYAISMLYGFFSFSIYNCYKLIIR